MTNERAEKRPMVLDFMVGKLTKIRVAISDITYALSFVNVALRML
jgi:hypothetical protein